MTPVRIYKNQYFVTVVFVLPKFCGVEGERIIQNGHSCHTETKHIEAKIHTFLPLKIVKQETEQEQVVGQEQCLIVLLPVPAGRDSDPLL